jgi:hypothetical protein
VVFIFAQSVDARDDVDIVAKQSDEIGPSNIAKGALGHYPLFRYETSTA